MSDAKPTAIVTGAASGIGRAIAIRLADLGYRLVLLDRDHDGLGKLQTALTSAGSCEHECVFTDVADGDAWRGFAETLAHDRADVALLVQAAGVLVAGRLVECDVDDLQRLISINLTGVLLGAQAVGPLLAQGAKNVGRPPLPRGVLNIASIFGTVSPPGFAAYNASKAGVVALTETLRGEWEPLGLAATAVLPGITPTALFDNAAYANDALAATAKRRVAAAELTADSVAAAAIDAYRRRRLVVPIGKRASRFFWLKRLLPGVLAKRVAAEAQRELGD